MSVEMLSYFYAHRMLDSHTTASHMCASGGHAECALDAAICDMLESVRPRIDAAVAFSLSATGEVELIGAATLEECHSETVIAELVNFACGGNR